MAELWAIPNGEFALVMSNAATSSKDLRHKLYDAMTQMAGACVERGLTQAAADILAFLLLQSELDAPSRNHAEIMFADLEGRICPRVIYDARELATGMDLLTMIEYALEMVDSEPNLTLRQGLSLPLDQQLYSLLS